MYLARHEPERVEIVMIMIFVFIVVMRMSCTFKLQQFVHTQSYCLLIYQGMHHNRRASNTLLSGFDACLQYEWDPRAQVISWSDANFICSIRDGVNELKSMLAGDTYRVSSDVVYMEDTWKDHLKDKMQEDGYTEMLKLLILTKFVQCGQGQVMFYFIINLSYVISLFSCVNQQLHCGYHEMHHQSESVSRVTSLL